MMFQKSHIGGRYKFWFAKMAGFGGKRGSDLRLCRLIVVLSLGLEEVTLEKLVLLIQSLPAMVRVFKLRFSATELSNCFQT